MTLSEKLYARAVEYLPGGVNSPVRAYKSVNRNPLFIEKASGKTVFDADGKAYTDYVGSWGPMILGHNHPEVKEFIIKTLEKGTSFGAPTKLEISIAEKIFEMVPSIERIRMVNSGTEAVMSALRAARGFTGKDKIIKFAGCYHGHCDSMLVKSGSGLSTFSTPSSAGVPIKTTEDTLIAVYNDIESVENLYRDHPGEIAAVIVEPVAANMGVVPPKENFLEDLRAFCSKKGILLIFDEVITGFRLAKGGAQEYFNIKADLTVFGKIIGGGLPVGAFGGRKEIMDQLSPLGPVYQAGTLSGNPLAMAAGYKTLEILEKNTDIYTHINGLGEKLSTSISTLAKEHSLPITAKAIGSLSSIFFQRGSIENYEEALKSDTGHFSQYFNFMLDQNIYIAPSQFEALFLSKAHEKEDIDYFIESIKMFFNI